MNRRPFPSRAFPCGRLVPVFGFFGLLVAGTVLTRRLLFGSFVKPLTPGGSRGPLEVQAQAQAQARGLG